VERTTMKTEFVKWGNSLALRIPAAFAKEVGASEGKRAEMTVEDDALIVKVARSKRRRRYSLGELIEGITPENYHSEVEWGRPVGNEAW
jgi:antitoxin MazE